MNTPKPKTLRIHPVCDLLPRMNSVAYEMLRNDIEKNGLIEPIWTKNGRIIDGRHRNRACHELGIEVRTREYEGEDIETFVISTSLLSLRGQEAADNVISVSATTA